MPSTPGGYAHGVRGVAIGLLLSIALSACGRPAATDEPSPPPRYRSVAEVQAALEKFGLGCADLQTVPSHHRDYGEEDAVDTGTCRVSNQDAVISMWSSLGNKQDWIRQRAVLGCQLSNDMGDNPPAYVDGGFWTVRVNTRMLAEDIARAIGGEPKVTDCASAWIENAS